MRPSSLAQKEYFGPSSTKGRTFGRRLGVASITPSASARRFGSGGEQRLEVTGEATASLRVSLESRHQRPHFGDRAALPAIDATASAADGNDDRQAQE
jgi:hypothetical protein